MKKLIGGLVLLSTAFLLCVWGCSSDDGGDDPTGPGPVDDVGSVSGIVSTGTRWPINGAVISAGGESTVTNQDGFFVLAQVPVGEQVVAVAMEGYMATFRTVTVVEGETVHLADLVLVNVETVMLNGASGGTAGTGDGTGEVEFGANSFETEGGAAYTGDVTVELNAMLPGEPDFYGTFPGDFEGVREDGTTTMFESFGFMTVNMYGADKSPLQLADGMTAGLSLDIGAEKAARAPATIPMWYYDETDGLWHEEGEAVLNGTVYEADVAHFTTWNWDLPIDDICRIEGYVHDDEGEPVEGARVLTSAVDYALRDEAFTNSEGFFSVRARKNSQTDIWAMKGARVSDVVRVTVGEACPVMLMDPLELVVPAFVVSLTWGESPSDLDSHLYIPMPWDDGEDPDWDWWHLYYSTDGTLADYPYTELDYDDTSSYGPENITGTRLYQGTYQYWVYNYSGYSGDGSTQALADSGAQVRLEIAGGIWIFDVADVPLQGADGTGWWHVFDVTVGSGGGATVTQVMEFQPTRDTTGVWPDGGWGKSLLEQPRK